MDVLTQKVLADDELDRRISPASISDPDKKGLYWMLTLYTQRPLEDFIKLAQGCPWVIHIVSQVEIGEVTKERHIHMSLIMDRSSRKPIPYFNKYFGLAHINSNRTDAYLPFCSKKYSRLPNTEPFIWHRTPEHIKDIIPYKRITSTKVVSKLSSNKDEEIKSLRIRLAKLESIVTALVRHNELELEGSDDESEEGI